MRVLSALEVGSPFFVATYKILLLVDRREDTVEKKVGGKQKSDKGLWCNGTYYVTALVLQHKQICPNCGRVVLFVFSLLSCSTV